ncbi:hypothetical protein HYZ76_01060 [Candidatus Falkowbacteria bacterium]|nr:hypothetical protein [Candidatus Falkowbacteria bacterium]
MIIIKQVFKGMRKRSLFLIILTAFLISGCISFGNSQPPGVAGVFKSFDYGATWTPKNTFLYSGGVGNIAGVNVIDVIFDPSDPKAIYLTTESAGLFYSYDSGDSFMKANPVGDGRIESVAVDPKNKCVIYATYANTILKTVDCGRSWAETYIDTRADKLITALGVDHFDNLVVYAGNNGGDILKSVDGGRNWQVIERLNNQIKKILIDQNDSRKIYVATLNRGIFKTISAGADWFEINEDLRKYSGALEFRDLVFDTTLPDSLFLVAKYGLIKTLDGGNTWQALTLITPPATTDIHGVAISPFNNKEIYYSTASTFYKTTDGGENWITTRLPSAAIGTALTVDPINPNVIYMGMANPVR